MTWMEIFGYFGALGIGLVMGLTGSGGSILSVPILAYLFNYDEKTATAYSLFIVGVTAAVGSFRVIKEKMIHPKMVLFFGLPAVLGILLTRSWIIPYLPEKLFEINGFPISRRMFVFGLFACLMLLAFYTMTHKAKHNLEDNIKETPIRFHPLIVTEGFFLGVFMGIVGAGGGFLMVPAMMLIANLSVKKAIGTSMVIVCLNSLAGFFLGDFLYMKVDWKFLFSFVVIALIGVMIGGKLNHFVNGQRLKAGFAYFILVMAIFIFIMEFVIIEPLK